MHRTFFVAALLGCFGLSATPRAFILDTSSMTGNLTWSNGLGSTAAASIEYVEIEDSNWNFVYNWFQTNRYVIRNASVLWLNEISVGTPVPGVLGVQRFGIYDVSPFFSFPVVGLEREFLPDDTLTAALGGNGDPQDEPNSSQESGWLRLNNLQTGSFNVVYPENDPMHAVDLLRVWVAGGYVLSPPVSYTYEKFILFGSLVNTSSDPDNPYYVLTLNDGLKMSLSADLRPTGVPVPEPATITLGAGALLAALRRRR